MKNIFFHSKGKYIFSLCFAIVCTIIYVFINDKYFQQPLFSFMNGTFIAGFVLMLIGGLSILSNLGAFDIFSYQFKKKGTGENRYTLFDHQQQRIEKSKTKKLYFVPYMVVGALFIVISILLTIVYYSNVRY